MGIEDIIELVNQDIEQKRREANITSGSFLAARKFSKGITSVKTFKEITVEIWLIGKNKREVVLKYITKKHLTSKNKDEVKRDVELAITKELIRTISNSEVYNKLIQDTYEGSTGN